MLWPKPISTKLTETSDRNRLSVGRVTRKRKEELASLLKKGNTMC